MKQIETVKASKLLEVFEHIEEIRQKRADREIWYRGLSSQNFKLSPGLHRRRKKCPSSFRGKDGSIRSFIFARLCTIPCSGLTFGINFS